MKCIPNVDVHSNDKDTLSTPIVGSRPCMHPVSTSSSYTENLLVNPLGVLPKNSSSKGLAQEQANNDTLFCFSNSLNKETENLCTTNNISSHQSEATMEDTFSHKEDAFNQNEDVFTYKEDVFNNKGDMVHQKEDAFKIEINYFPSSIENSAFSGTPGRDDTTEQSNIHEITKDETCIIHSINTDRTSNGEISDFGVLSEGHSEISKNLSPQTKDCVTEEVAKESEKQPFSIGVDGVKNTYDHVVNFSHGRNVSNQTMCSTDISQLDHLQIAFTGNSTDTQLILIKQEPVEFEENQQMFTTLQSEIETDNINTQMSGHEFGSENFIIKEEIDPYMECEFQNSTDPGLLSLNSTDPGLLSSNSTDPGLLSSNSTDPGLLSLNSTDPGLLSLNSEVMIAAQKKDRKRKLVKTDKPKKVERNVKNKIKKSKISAVDLESNKTKSVAKGNSKIMKIKINKKSKKLKGNSKIEQKTDSPMIKTHKKCTRARRKKTDFNSDESMNNTHENLNEKARGKTSTEKKCRKPCSKSKNLSTKTKKSGPNKKANSDRKPRTKTKESIPNFMGVQKEQTECVKIVHDIMQDFDSELHLAAKNNNDETVPRSVYHSDEECFGDVIVKTEQDNDPQYYKSQMTFEPGNNITGMKEETGMVMLNSVQESESIKDQCVTERSMSLCERMIDQYFIEDSPTSVLPKNTYKRQLKDLETKGLLTEFRNKEASRSRSYRASMSDDKRKQYNQNTKERMARYRQRLKDKPSNTTCSRHRQKLKDKPSNTTPNFQRQELWDKPGNTTPSLHRHNSKDKPSSATSGLHGQKLKDKQSNTTSSLHRQKIKDKPSNTISSPCILTKKGQTLKMETKGLLTEFRKKEANRQRLYRVSMSDEKRKQYSQNSKERMARYRQKLKDKANNTTSSSLILKRREKEINEEDFQQNKRLYWRIKQQKSRSRQTFEKKQDIKNKRKLEYNLKKKSNTACRNLDGGNALSSNNIEKDNVVSLKQVEDYDDSTACEKRKQYNQNTKERMARYRQKLKDNANNTASSSLILKSKEKEINEEDFQQNKRLYWRIKKQKSRSRQTFEKKQEIKNKRKLEYNLKKKSNTACRNLDGGNALSSNNIEKDNVVSLKQVEDYDDSTACEKRKQYNQNTKERMARYRQKLKDNANNTASSSLILKSKEKEINEEDFQQNKRLYWRIKQQKSRSRQTFEKKQEIKKKRKLEYNLKKKSNSACRNLDGGNALSSNNI